MSRSPSSRPGDLSASLFGHPGFLLFCGARGASYMASQMLAVAVGWQVYALTRSPLDLGLVGLVQFLPALCFSLVVGHVADRYDRRMILRIAETVEALAAAALALGTIQGWLDRDGIFAIVAVSGTARAFEQPVLQATVPSLVPAPVVARAIALAASASQAAVIVGPAIGGFIYALGAQVDYAVCAALYILACLLLTPVRIVRVPVARAPVTLETLLAGISYIRAKKAILGAMSLDLFAVLLGGATALLPIYARDILFVGPSGLGLLRSAPAVGALTVSILLSRRAIQRRAGVIVLASVALFGVMTLVFALSTWFWLSLAALVVLGASDSVSVVIRNSLVQLETPDAMRGRVSAVHSLFIGSSNTLGEFESGVTAAWLGTVPAVLLGGIGTLVVVALWIKLFPDLVKFDQLRDRREPASATQT